MDGTGRHWQVVPLHINRAAIYCRRFAIHLLKTGANVKLQDFGDLHARVGIRTGSDPTSRNSSVAVVQQLEYITWLGKGTTIGVEWSKPASKVSRTCVHVRSMQGQQSIITCSAEASASPAPVLAFSKLCGAV